MHNKSAAQVAQGCFPGGAPAQLKPSPTGTAQRRAAGSSRRPQTYEELTAQAHQRGGAARTVQPATDGTGTAFALPPHLSHSSTRRPGQRLPPSVRQKMEAFFGADFSDVQVRVGPEAGSIGALAFTQGTDIFFAPGQYNPATAYGQQILGHELTHVVQQRAGLVRNPLGAGVAVVHDPTLEAEAERMGARAAMFRMPAQPKMAPAAAAQRATPTHVSGPVRVADDAYKITAVEGPQTVGSVTLHARDRSRIELTDLGVAGTHRGHGHGQALLQSALRAGLRMGKKRVTLASQDDGTGKLTQWYKSLGFRQVGADARGYARMEAPISRVLSGTAQRRMASPPAAVQRRAAGKKKCGCGCGGCVKGARGAKSSLRFHPWRRAGSVQLARSSRPGFGKKQVTTGEERPIEFDPSTLEPAGTSGPRAVFGGGKGMGADMLMYAHAVDDEGIAYFCTQGDEAHDESTQPGIFEYYREPYNFPKQSQYAEWKKCYRAPDNMSERIKNEDKASKESTLAVRANLEKLAQKQKQTCMKQSGKGQTLCESRWAGQFAWLEKTYGGSNESKS